MSLVAEVVLYFLAGVAIGALITALATYCRPSP